MKLTGDWQVVAQRPRKNTDWIWSLDALERVVLATGVDEKRLDLKLGQKPGGHQEMLARDRWQAMRTRMTVLDPAPATEGTATMTTPSVHAASAESPALTVRTAVPARRMGVPIILLPRAHPIGMRTYVPYFGDPARWCDRPAPRLRPG